MKLLEVLPEIRRHLEENGRISYRMLRREFDLDDEALEELVEELVDIQHVAAREERALVWTGSTSGAPAASPAPKPERSPRDYTPKHLVDKILQSKSALEGERKQVTVLFADVKGSMELAEQVDPEEWHRILDRFFQILTDGIHRFEGTVNQYTGDGIMALFGAPIAHEDHAQRACYAALQLREELRQYADSLRLERGLNFGVRMGLNSGEVVVGKIGDDLRMDYTAQGHTVGIAQRLEQIASTDSAFLAESTARLVEGYFQLRDLGESELRGNSEPLRVYELEGMGSARVRLDVSHARGLTKFIGRRDEMASLEAALDRARQGHGQVVGVVAEAGTGKSRLCFEFAERCRARGLEVHEARGLTYGQSLPFEPIRELFRSYYGIGERDSADTARQKIAGRLVLLDETFHELLPAVFEFLGVADPLRPSPPADPVLRQRQLHGLVRRGLQAEGAGEPRVTLLEDLHWFDDQSAEFLKEIVDAVAQSKSLLLVNFRPEFSADWMQRVYYQQLPLVPLGRDAAQEVLSDLLGVDPSLMSLSEQIQIRTGGNPFFIEEVVQSLVDSGALTGVRGAYALQQAVERIEIPATVQSLLASRIDRLPETEKKTLQRAAVIGAQFDEPTLAEIAELPGRDLHPSLDLLKDAGFIYEQRLYPTAEYLFKHPLTQEVAYHSQLALERAGLHAEVARAIAKLHPDALDEHAALLSHHWEGAGERLEAARWSVRAAGHTGMAAAEETWRHWGRARDLVSSLEQEPETAKLMVTACRGLLNLGWRMGMEAEEEAAILADGARRAREIDDLHGLAELYALGGGGTGAGRIEVVLERSGKALELAEAVGDPQLLADATGPRSMSLQENGQLTEALSLWDRALVNEGVVGVGLWGLNEFAYGLAHRGYLLALMGRVSEAETDLARAASMARREGDDDVLSQSAYWRAVLAYLTGDSSEAMRAERASFESARRLQHSTSRLFSLLAAGIASILESQWERGVGVLEEAAGVYRSGIYSSHLSFSLLSHACLGSGDLEGSMRAVTEASGFPDGTLAALSGARAMARTGDTRFEADIDEAIARAARDIDTSGARGLEPLLAEARAEVSLQRRDIRAQREQLGEAHRLYVEMGAKRHAERLARELQGLSP